MGQSDKKFVMRHSFEKVMNMKEGETVDGPIEKHFNIPWKIRISRENRLFKVFLNCMVPADNGGHWSIDTYTAGKVFKKYETAEYINCSIIYTKEKFYNFYKSYPWTDLADVLNDGCYVFEFTVIILKTAGLNFYGPKSRKFDDELARENSDVTLIVQDRKFHVIKLYLSLHSSYFKALFFGSLSESGKSEIELKEIDPNDFQLFLDLIYGETSVEDSSVLEILHLADFFDSKTAIGRCEYFLVEKSNLSLKEKFDASIKYKLEELKRKCISQLKTHGDFLSIVPDDPSQFDCALWKELFVKSNSLEK